MLQSRESSYANRTVAVGILTLVMVVVAIMGCSDTPVVHESPDILPETPHRQSTDSVSLEDDVLEYTDGPDEWRWERDLGTDTTIDIYKNDDKVASVKLDVVADTAVSGELTDPESGEWIETDGNDVIIATSVGMQDCYPEDPGCECEPEEPFCAGPVEFMGGDCDTEFAAVVGAFAGTGVMMGLTAAAILTPSAQPLALPFVKATAGATAAAATAHGVYAACALQ